MRLMIMAAVGMLVAGGACAQPANRLQPFFDAMERAAWVRQNARLAVSCRLKDDAWLLAYNAHARAGRDAAVAKIVRESDLDAEIVRWALLTAEYVGDAIANREVRVLGAQACRGADIAGVTVAIDFEMERAAARQR